MMHMTFYWGRDVTLLLDSWKTKTWTEYSLTLLACFLFSAFYQYMEDRRIRFKQLQLSSSSTSTTAASPPSSVATSPLLYSKLAAGGGRWILGKFAGSALFGINAAIGYLLMLAVMSYNGGVFIAIVLGLSVGYSLFRNSDEDVLVVDNPCGCA